jgi:hypothetical protein
MSRRKLIAFAAIAAVGTLTILVLALLAVDLYLHQRAERSAGLNRWGYRGPVVGRKQPNEIRVVVAGGSTVFGYGGPADEAIPSLLETELNRGARGTFWRAINIGYNTEGAFAFRANLEDFAFLDYDVVVLYEGYNDLMGDGAPNNVVVRRESPLFRLTGYFPILPLVFLEKAATLRTGKAASAYSGLGRPAPTVFSPSRADRASAAALETAASIATSLERQLGHLSDTVPSAASLEVHGCAAPWAFYCDAQYRAIQYATERQKRVVVVSQPQLVGDEVRAVQDSQQTALAGMIARMFPNRSDVVYLDLRRAVDLSDLDVSFDQMHLSVDGNRLVAAALSEPIRSLVAR